MDAARLGLTRKVRKTNAGEPKHLSQHRLLDDTERLHLNCVHDLLDMRVRNVLRGCENPW